MAQRVDGYGHKWYGLRAQFTFVKLKQFATRLAITLFRAIRGTKRGLQHACHFLGRMLGPVGRLIVRLLILPIYGMVITAKLRINRLAIPARGLALFFITNRFLLHGTIGLLMAIGIAANIQARQAHAQDVGQTSLLFALATDQQNEIVHETIRPEQMAKNTKYLSDASIVSIPHIDFDYDENLDQTLSSTPIPGTIAAIPFESSETTPSAPRTKTETYIVQDNDTISTIARKFRVNVGTILWSNNLTERQYIRPGDALKIPPVSGVLITVKKGDTLGKLANIYSGNADDIATVNQLNANDPLSVGSELVIPDGRPPELVQTRARIIAQNSDREQIREPSAPSRSVSDTITSQSPTPVPKPADVDTSKLPSTKLLWPTSGHVITQYYGWKHTGIDIDGDYSSPLYASADGVIEKAGWNNGGYGLMILMDHPNGTKTRYGHASKLFVKAGDTVKRGQVIAMMGTTGRSTGTHLHFEVYVNGKRTNPLAYIR